jgi:hypothetical protein
MLHSCTGIAVLLSTKEVLGPLGKVGHPTLEKIDRQLVNHRSHRARAHPPNRIIWSHRSHQHHLYFDEPFIMYMSWGGRATEESDDIHTRYLMNSLYIERKYTKTDRC